MSYHFDAFGNVYLLIDNILHILSINDKNDLEFLEIFNIDEYDCNIKRYKIANKIPEQNESYDEDNLYYLLTNEWTDNYTNYIHDDLISSFSLFTCGTDYISEIKKCITSENSFGALCIPINAIYDTYLFIDDKLVNVLKSYDNNCYRIHLYVNKKEMILIHEDKIKFYEYNKKDINKSQLYCIQ